METISAQSRFDRAGLLRARDGAAMAAAWLPALLNVLPQAVQ